MPPKGFVAGVLGQDVPRKATCHERKGFVATFRRIPPGWVDAQFKVLPLRARATLQPCPQKSKGAAFHASPDASATPIAYADTVNKSAGGVQADGSHAVTPWFICGRPSSRPNRRSRRRRRRNHGWRHCRSRWRGRRRGRRRPSSWRGRRRLSSSKSAPFKRPRHAADIGASGSSGLRRRFFLHESGWP